ncbi:2-dehydro-3-deoxygalactonokinase [Ramlibacter tataouinensis]|uniref:2-oxo-3-deoxygalactonate kinase n=1 Tax=Ramlibacter tataouinensis (strain ATCC BAA-407 / DSM 14655 / LMG 21543 / TTB310) TaxID=365046 RepID=F5Y115_RAMTT|nr:2-dehydro-3-deoxygalactonokinase [Ramlibacter tataouinensis]AEG92233.1 2-oxo-3-deoxygalactonate kinase [Ramlibacter tataouinensis TTB310]
MGAPLIAVDWGTSSLRAALLDAAGRVLEERSAPQGILAVPPDGFPAVLAAACRGWEGAGARGVLMSGMVGSRQGWQEAAYCPCPAGFGDVAARLLRLPDLPPLGRVAIVPGLRCEHDGLPDVMRGEETQAFGALELLGLQDGLLLLPGTHSKWVQVRGGRIESFSTFMTGEVYGLLRRQSILARTLPESHDDELDRDAFLRGVGQAREAGSLLRSAFGVRTLALFESLPAAFLPSYLSGLVIGDELRLLQPAPAGGPVVLIGAPALTLRYELALQSRGIACRRVGPEATWRGLWAIARTVEDFA